jgi:hypothetical protein
LAAGEWQWWCEHLLVSRHGGVVSEASVLHISALQYGLWRFPASMAYSQRPFKIAMTNLFVVQSPPWVLREVEQHQEGGVKMTWRGWAKPSTGE